MKLGDSVRRRGVIVIALVFLATLSTGVCFAKNGSSTESRYVVIVDDPELVSNNVIQKVRELGGYFSSLSNQEVSVKVPSDNLTEYLRFVENQGEVARQQYFANDIRAELEAQKTSLKSKESVFEQYISVLNESKVDKLIYVEQEVAKLVQEIEYSKGKLRLLQHKIDFAQVSIRFQFRDRSAPVASKDSSFPWLNNVGITRLLSEFQNVSQ